MFKDYISPYSIILIAGILLAVILFFVIPEKQEYFATIYTLNSKGSFGNYSDDITVGVKNNLGHETDFTVFYKKDNDTIKSWSLSIPDNQSHEFATHLKNTIGDDIFELWYKNGDIWTNSGKWVSLKQD
jgi:hypothetical protein